MVKREYAIWGTKKGHEDIVRINGQEVQTDFNKVKKLKSILESRKEFDKIRIQSIDRNNFDLKSSFTKGLKRKK